MKKLAFLLIAALCLSLLPVGVWAEAEPSASEELSAETAEPPPEAEEDLPTVGEALTEENEPADPPDEETDAAEPETIEEPASENDTEEATAPEDRIEPADASEFPAQAAPSEGETPALDGATSGDCGKNGSNVTWTLSEDGVLTISGEGEMRDYNIGGVSTGNMTTAPWGYAPKKLVVEYGVTSIGNCAFTLCEQITDIFIASSVTSIGEYAFLGCIGLSEITFTNGLRDIGKYAFCGCYNLTCVTLGHNVNNIGARAFSAESSSAAPLEMTLRFIGNAPTIGKDAFFKSTITASYPENDPSWTTAVRQSYGGSVDWQPGDYFLIGVHNNSFWHNVFTMGALEPAEGEEGTTYAVSNALLKKLLQGNLMNRTAVLDKMNEDISENQDHYGTCEGLSLSMILANAGVLEIDQICENPALIYHDVSRPVDEVKLKELINYYQLLQTAHKLKQDAVHSRYINNIYDLTHLTSWEDFWDGFFEAVREGCRKNTGVLFSCGCNEFAHSMVACGIDESHNDYTLVKLYDCNCHELHSNKILAEAEQYIYLVVYHSDVKNEAYLVNSKNPNGGRVNYFTGNSWTYFKYYSVDTILSIDAGLDTLDVQTDGAAPCIVFETDIGAAFTLKNAEGQTFSYDGTDYSGNMELLDLDFMAFDESSTICYSFPASGSFTLKDFEDGAEYKIISEDSYYTASATGADEILFTDGRGVEIAGEDYTFSVGISMTDTAGLMRATGTAGGKGQFLHSQKSGKALELIAGYLFTDVSVRTITEDGVTEESLSGSSNRITVYDSGKPYFSDEDPVDDADGDCRVNWLDAAYILRAAVGLEHTGKQYTPADAARILSSLPTWTIIVRPHARADE